MHHLCLGKVEAKVKTDDIQTQSGGRMFIVLFKLKAYQTYNIENIAKSIIFGLDLFLKLSTFETYWKTLKALIVDQPCRNSVFVPEVPVVNLEKQRWN